MVTEKTRLLWCVAKDVSVDALRATSPRAQIQSESLHRHPNENLDVDAHAPTPLERVARFIATAE